MSGDSTNLPVYRPPTAERALACDMDNARNANVVFWLKWVGVLVVVMASLLFWDCEASKTAAQGFMHGWAQGDAEKMHAYVDRDNENFQLNRYADSRIKVLYCSTPASTSVDEIMVHRIDGMFHDHGMKLVNARKFVTHGKFRSETAGEREANVCIWVSKWSHLVVKVSIDDQVLAPDFTGRD